MFIDFLTLMLINMSAGFFLLACFLLKDLSSSRQEHWAPAFLLTGLVALLCGFRITWTWPLPGSYNVAFGESSVFFGALMTAAAWAMAKGWDLKPLGIYGFFAGLASTVIGAQFIRQGLSATPLIAGIGFILSGIAGLFSLPMLYWPRSQWLRVMGIIILITTSLLWAYIGYPAYSAHLLGFAARH